MAVYKVIQDVEAEDKLLGPLTLKGFIYAAVAGLLAFINIRIAIGATGGAYRFIIILILFFPMALFAVLASPLGREQPTEVWLLSHIRFLFKPKQRLWDQLGMANLVTITVPKKPELQLTKNLTQREVMSRLETLALTLDSRGWAIKNVYNDGGQSAVNTPLGYLRGNQTDSDRLVKPDPSESQISSISDIHPNEDVLDLKNSARAQEVDSLMQQKALELKETRLARMDAIRRGVITPQTMSALPRPTPHISTRHDTLYTEQQLRGIKPKNISLAQNADGITIDSVSKVANNSHPPARTQLAPGEIEVDLR